MTIKEMSVGRKAVNAFGTESQMIVAIEELSELTKEITKYLRDKGDINHISEEMADVKIVIAQLELMLDNSSLISLWESKKLKRLEDLINDVGRESR